jgi:hypothetical protein
MSLAQRQAELVAALVAGAPDPPGFSERHLEAARAALLAKRAEEVRRVWPALSAAYGKRWHAVFGEWARSRPPQGALRDGWDFASHHPPEGAALVELRVKQALWSRSRSGALHLRRLPALRLAGGGRRKLILQVAGRIFLVP